MSGGVVRVSNFFSTPPDQQKAVQPCTAPDPGQSEWRMGHLVPERVTGIATRLTPWCVRCCSPGQQASARLAARRAKQSAIRVSTADIATMPVRRVLHEAMHDARDWLALAEVQPFTAGRLAPLNLPDGA